MKKRQGTRIPEEFRRRAAYRIRRVMKPYAKDEGHMVVAAADIGVAYWTVWSWYNGVSLPTLYNLVRFANYYEVSIDYILDRTGAKEVATVLEKVG